MELFSSLGKIFSLSVSFAGMNRESLTLQKKYFKKGGVFSFPPMQEEDDARLYLDSISADFYFNDVVSMLLKAQPEDPIEFMCEYFQSIHDMEHVVNKRFEYVNATAYNRRSFLHTCLRSFGHFGDAQEVVIGDLFQLVTLLCSDYPETRMFEIPRLLRYDPSALLPFGELRIAFSVHFVYYGTFYLYILFSSSTRPDGYYCLLCV